jgi:sensor histidine kinase YesM
LLAIYSYLNILFTEGYRLFGYQLNGFYLFLGLLTAVFLVWELDRFLEKYLEYFERITRNKLHPLIIFFLLSLINVVVIAAIGTLVIALLLHEPAEELAFHFKVSLGFVFRINLFLNSINAIVYFMDQLKKSQLETEQLKKQNLEAQFEALRSQINPHFLFNSLNVLSALVYKDPTASAEFIQQLSKVYRYLLYYQEKKVVVLAEELHFLDAYVYLLKIRFKDNLEIIIKVPKHYHQYYIAPASLQLLIENAIKHNIVSAKHPLIIRIIVKEDKYLIVENNLQEKINKEHSTSVGLKNISRRYKFISNEQVIVLRNETKFSVQIPIIQLADI